MTRGLGASAVVAHARGAGCLVAIAVALVLSLAGAPGAWAATLNWQSPQPYPTNNGPDVPGGGSVSCLSQQLCAVVGRYGFYDEIPFAAFTTDPTAAAPTWTNGTNSSDPAKSDGGDSVSCPSADLCVAVDHGDVATTTDPTSSSSPTFTDTAVDSTNADLSAISCPTSSLCVAVDAKGYAFASSTPTAGTSGWKGTRIDTQSSSPADSLVAVSCTASAICVAVDAAGDAYVSTDPAAQSPTWTKDTIDPGNNLASVDCPASNFCVATDQQGYVLTTSTPASAWTSDHIDATGQPSGVSCMSSSLCVVVDKAGYAYVSSTPAAKGSWTQQNIDPGIALVGVSCTTDQMCVAIDTGQAVVGLTSAPGSLPTVTTGTAGISYSTASPTGTVNPNSSMITNCQFDYGTTASYGSSAPCTETDFAGSSPVQVTANLTNLTPGTTYDYRLEATNAHGTGYGASATFTTIPLLSPSGYEPDVDGFGFGNNGSNSYPPGPFSTLPSYAQMASYYPATNFYHCVPFTSLCVWTITGTAFYKLIFSQIYNDGQCYAFSVLSAELFGNSPPRQPYLDGNAFEPASLLGSLGGTGNIWDALSRTESTLLGAGGALDAADAYYDSAVDVDGNAGIFQDIAKGVMSGPVVLGLAPIPTLSALLQYGGDMHTVVAYDTGIDGGTAPQDQTVPNDPYVGDPQIEIYNPNDPATGPPQEPNESNYPDFIDLTPDGGIWMPFSIFIGDSAYGMGPPADWLLVPLPSDTWTSASNDQWVGADVPLAVLEGINNGVWSLGPGVPFFLPGGEAGSGGQGHAPLVMKLPRGKGFAGSVTAGGGRETVTQLVGNRVAIATRESSPRGSTSGVRIDADASSLHVAAGRGTERFDLTLGHDLSASYGREVELAGLSLAPKASVTLSSDSSARTFTLTSSLRSGDIGVVASLTQVGRNAGTASAVVQLPAGEAKATVRVDNWNALASRPIYESITQDGKTHVFELASFLVTRATWGRDRLKLTIAKLPKGDRLRITLYYTHGRRRTLTTAKAASTITTARPTRLVLRAYRRNHQQGASVTVTKLPSNERQR